MRKSNWFTLSALLFSITCIILAGCDDSDGTGNVITYGSGVTKLLDITGAETEIYFDLYSSDYADNSDDLTDWDFSISHTSETDLSVNLNPETGVINMNNIGFNSVETSVAQETGYSYDTSVISTSWNDGKDESDEYIMTENIYILKMIEIKDEDNPGDDTNSYGKIEIISANIDEFIFRYFYQSDGTTNLLTYPNQ